MTTYDSDSVDLREKLAHIDQMLADHDRKRQEIRLAPWQLVLTTVVGTLAASAGLVAATVTIIRLFMVVPA